MKGKLFKQKKIYNKFIIISIIVFILNLSYFPTHFVLYDYNDKKIISKNHYTSDYYIEEGEDNNLEFIAFRKRRKYNEAEKQRLEDFYSDINNYKDKGYDMDTVYTFFFKLYYISEYYRTLNIELDIPLIMSVLTINSDNMNEIFISNTMNYNVSQKKDNPYFSINYDWSNYTLSEYDSSHDIEILAQNMVKNSCSEGENPCYKLKDENEYKEYLLSFIENKYFLQHEANQNETNPGAAVGEYRNWKQSVGPWKSMKVPSSSKTIGQIGCLITSVTMQIVRSGTKTVVSPVDPGVAIKYFEFYSGGNFLWESASNLAPNFIYRGRIDLVGMSKENVAKKLSSYDPKKNYIILGVSEKNRDSIHHFVALDYVNLSNNKLYMMDPSSKTDSNDVYEYYKVYRAHIYEKKD